MGAARFGLAVFGPSHSARAFGDAGTNANGVSTAAVALRVFFCDDGARFGGSRRLGGGDKTNWISSTSSSRTTGRLPWSSSAVFDAGAVNAYVP